MFKEGEKTELKKSLADEDGILEALCAFANTNGGAVLVGIDDAGKAVGVSIGKNSLEQLARKITEGISPPLYPHLDEVDVDGHTIIRITVQKSEHSPHFYKGIAYKRVGRMDKAVSPQELAALFRAKLLGEQHFDDKVCERAMMDDIDPQALKRFAAAINVPFISVGHTLRSLKLIKDKRLVNAAVLFFGRTPSLLFPLYGVKCAIFSQRGEIEAMKDFGAGIFSIVDEVVSYILENSPKRLVFETAMRKEVPVVPDPAIREAVVNALIHRDYTFPSSVYVAIYPDRIAIKNPGMLPSDLTEKELYGEHHSHPQNPLIAEIAHKAGYIEHWGTGTLRIISSMRGVGLDDPEFKQDKGFFYVTLFFRRLSLTRREESILAILRELETATAAGIYANLKDRVSSRAVRKDILNLTRRGLIIKKGRSRDTRYTILVRK